MIQVDRWIEVLWFIFIFIIILLSILRLYLIRWWNKHEEIIDPEFNPKVHVVIPCKGIDINMEDNLKSVLKQKYTNFDVTAVVDSEDDPSVHLIRSLKIGIVITDPGYTGSGKVKAISTAIRDIPPEDVIVLVDSDTMVSDQWLSYLINPLRNDKMGAVSPMFLFFLLISVPRSATTPNTMLDTTSAPIETVPKNDMYDVNW